MDTAIINAEQIYYHSASCTSLKEIDSKNVNNGRDISSQLSRSLGNHFPAT